MKLSERLKTLRQETQTPIKDLCETLGILNRAYHFYEQGGREPSLKNLIALADFYGVSIDYLVGRTDDPRMR